MSSINTNNSALSRLDRYNSVATNLNQTNKRVSTGLKVADAFDNGAVFAIAQGLRSDSSSLSAVNGQLGAAQGRSMSPLLRQPMSRTLCLMCAIP